MQKYFKKDIADLLKNGLDVNAYGRAEGFMVELNLSSCYDFVEQFCLCISSHLSIMNKQRECPEECREAIPSLMFAAARFSDLPELRELRGIFAQRYGNSLEPYASKEFVARLESLPPTKDMKLQLIQDIALESGIEWDSKALEQKLYTPPATEQDPTKNIKVGKHKLNKTRVESIQKIYKETEYKRSNVKDYTVEENAQEGLSSHGKKEVTNDKHKLDKSNSDSVQKIYKDTEYKYSTVKEYVVKDNTQGDRSSSGKKEVANDEQKLHIRRENNVLEDKEQAHLPFKIQKNTPSKDIHRTSIELNAPQNNPKSAKSASNEEVDDKKHLNYRSVPPPYYIKPKASTNETSLKVPPISPKSNGNIGGEDKQNKDKSIGETKPIPRSVRSRRLKFPPDHGNLEKVNSDERRKINSSDKKQDDVRQSLKILNKDDNYQQYEEESVVDRLLVYYSKKQSPSEAGKVEDVKHRSKDGFRNRATSLPHDPISLTLSEATKGHARAASLESDMLNTAVAVQVHPMLPEYDDFVARLAALRGK